MPGHTLSVSGHSCFGRFTKLLTLTVHFSGNIYEGDFCCRTIEELRDRQAFFTAFTLFNPL